MTRIWDRMSAPQSAMEHTSAVRSMRRFILDTTGLGPGDTVLDLGCGPGIYLATLREAVGDGGHVVGLDLSPKSVRGAARRVERHGWHNVDLITADATTTDLGTERFDTVIALYALSAMVDFPAAIRRAHAALRPGGTLFVADVRLVPGGRAAPLIRLLRAIYRGLAKATGRDVAPAVRAVFETVTFPDGRAFDENLLPHWPPLLMLVATKGQAGD